MPVAVQTQTFSYPHPVRMMTLQPAGAVASAFTAVNGQTSPSSASATRPNTQDGGRPDSFPPQKPYAQPSLPAPRPEPQTKPVLRTDLHQLPRMRESSRDSTSPHTGDPQGTTPMSPPKRKFAETNVEGTQSPSRALAAHGARSSYTPDSSPRDAFPGSVLLPPINVNQRPEHEQAWPHRETNILPTPQPRNPHESTSSLNGLLHMGQSTPEQRPELAGLQMTSAGVLVNPDKKRKRQFANRTKTGCGTCRRRKKKCDETKPHCKNCTRGAFHCEGYAVKSHYGKPGVVKTQPPLQSKDQYTLDPPPLFHNHGTVSDNTPTSSTSERSLVHPSNAENVDRSTSNTTWGGWGERPRVPDYQHSLPMTQSRPPATHPPEPVPHSLHQTHPPQQPNGYPPHAPRTSTETKLESPMHRHVPPPPTPPVHQATPQGPAIGLPAPVPPHYVPAPPQPRERSEKEKMLAGEPFYPYHPILVNEREHCSKAVWRYNCTDNPPVIITPEERHRIFQGIVMAKWLPRNNPDYIPQPVGYVGSETYIEKPFQCDYGYNIVIEDMVVISPGCKLLDSGKIRIGKRSRLGANVTIDTQKMPEDSKSDKGSWGLVVAAEVCIGENVYVGTGSIIMAGVKIGNNAIINPGSVVMKDVPANCSAKGNPANVSSVFWNE